MPFADPDRAKNHQRQYRREQRAGEGCTGGCTTLPVKFRLQTAQDVIDLLGDQVLAVRAENEAGALEKARVIGYLASIALRAIETGKASERPRQGQGTVSG
jgi:hypothetical protein